MKTKLSEVTNSLVVLQKYYEELQDLMLPDRKFTLESAGYCAQEEFPIIEDILIRSNMILSLSKDFKRKYVIKLGE